MVSYLTKKKLIFIAILLLVLGAFIYFGLYLGFLPLTRVLEKKIAQYNTLYVEGFSWDKMSQVRDGMTPQEVLQIMGAPYGGMPDKPFCPSWSYGNPNPWKRIPPFAGDFWYVTAQVCFDETGRVSNPGIENVFFN